MKAEHYLTSGLNRMPTSVARMDDCISHAFDPELARGPRPTLEEGGSATQPSSKTHRDDIATFTGLSLPSQDSWRINGLALVTDVPITWLGYVNRETGVIEHPGHPLDGECVEGRILIYPKGSGSTVAPYVLMGLIYSGHGPLAVVNSDVCPLTLPACSLLGIPYAHGFTEDPCLGVNSGDEVDLLLEDDAVTLQILRRAPR
jgi:predicted aconitase with swiveling domain